MGKLPLAILTVGSRYPRSTLAVAGLLTLASILLILRLTPDTAVSGLLNPDNPSVQATQKVLERFPAAEEHLILVSLRGTGLVGQHAADRPPVQQNELLLSFASRFESLAKEEAGPDLVAVRYRTSGDEERRFVQDVVIPAGLLYLDEQGLIELHRRLTPQGMAEQLEKTAAALSAPGPAAAGLSKTLAQDPLRLYELLTARLQSSFPQGSPFASGYTLSPDGRSLLIRVEGKKPPSDLEFTARFTAALDRAAKRANTDALDVISTGAYAITAHNARLIRADAISNSIWDAVLLAGLFLFMFRAPLRTFIAAALPVAVGVLWGFGIYAMFRSTITPLAAVVGGAMGGIGVDYSVHYLTKYRLNRLADPSVPLCLGASVPSSALVSHISALTTRRMAGPLFAAFMTSLIGFAAIGYSAVQILRDFAFLGALCLVGSWLATLTVLPALLTWLDRGLDHGLDHGLDRGSVLRGMDASSMHKDDAPNMAGEPHSSLPTPHSLLPAPPATLRFQFSAPLGAFLNRYRVACLSIALLSVAVLVCFARPITFEPTLKSLHPQPNPPLDAQGQLSARMGLGGETVVAYLEADTDEALLAASHRLSAALQSDRGQHHGVTGTLGLSSLLPPPGRLYGLTHNTRYEFTSEYAPTVSTDLRTALDTAGFDPDRFTDYIDFVSKLLQPTHVPAVADLRRYPQLARNFLPHDDGVPTPGEGLIQKPAAIQIITLAKPLGDADDAALALRQLRQIAGEPLTGFTVLNIDAQAAIRHELPRTAAIALVLNALYLLIYFKSLKRAALAMIPATACLLCLPGFIHLFDLPVSLVTIVMVPLLLGITVDYGLFAVESFVTAASTGELRHHFTAAADALVNCSASTVLGFGSLVTVSVPAVASLGWLINLGIGVCVAATFLILWPLLFTLMRRQETLVKETV